LRRAEEAHAAVHRAVPHGALGEPLERLCDGAPVTDLAANGERLRVHGARCLQVLPPFGKNSQLKDGRSDARAVAQLTAELKALFVEPLRRFEVLLVEGDVAEVLKRRRDAPAVAAALLDHQAL